MGRLTLLVLLLAAAPCRAATLTVCFTGCDYTSIPPAITAAAPGDTILVGAGTYAGAFTIDRSLSIVGEGSGLVRVTGTGASVITITAMGVSISGIHVDPASSVTRAIRATGTAAATLS